VSAPGVIYEFEAEYLMKLNDESKKADLIDAWEKLVERNPENEHYLFGLEKARNISDADRKAFWEELAQEYPKSTAIKVIPLGFLEGDEFRIAVDKYLRAFLTKGVPSTFVSLKFLYENPVKRQIIQDLAESYLEHLRTDSVLPPPLEEPSQPNGYLSKKELPSTLLWTLYFLALHYAHPKSQRDLARSMQFIEDAISHTPTLVELYLTKARLLKYENNLSGALDAIMAARDLDLQDRFVNTKVGKYLLRCNRNDEALQILKEFTRVFSLYI
jgi:N-alpha-acetyltransferase 15/16, NatA auxiliary subunit